MNSIKTQTLKGFRDFLPQEARERAWLKNVMISVYEKWGYQPLETPTLEPLEIFEGQIGEDEKLFYKFKDNGNRDVALRYDQTVPTCRVIGQYYNEITFPFRRYQIQSAFRAENPQKGRFREFTQSDADIFGVSSVEADAEVIAICLDLYKTLGFKDIVILVNNRDLIKDIPYTAISTIDKLDKIGEEGVIEDMLKKGIEKTQAEKYLTFVRNLQPDETIKDIFSYLEKAGFDKNWFKFEPTLMRAFSYSEGPIWEITIPGYTGGSVGGGERYDNLVEKISGQKVAGTGVGIGFDRTLDAVKEFGLLPILEEITKVLVTVFSADLMDKSLEISSKLRAAGINTELWLDSTSKLDKQLKYADQKQIPYAIIIGPDEATQDKVVLKDLTSKTQETLSLDETIQKLTS